MNLDQIQENIEREYNTITAGYSKQLIMSLILNDILATSIAGTSNNYVSIPRVNAADSNVLTLGLDVPPFDTQKYIHYSSDRRDVFNSFNNAQLSYLTPQINLFIKDKSEITSIPLQNIHSKFNTVGNVLKTSTIYSFLGIKDITVRYNGDTLETAKLDIDTDIVFFGNTLAVFDKPDSPYLQLIYPALNNRGHKRSLMMQIGWNEITAEAKKHLKFSNAQQDAIRGQQLTFHMTYVKHSFNFSEDGSFTLTVSYVSALEDASKGMNFVELTNDELNGVYHLGVGGTRPVTLNETQEKMVNDYIDKEHRGLLDSQRQVVMGHIINRRHYAAARATNQEISAATERAKKMVRKMSTDRLANLLEHIKENNAAFTFYAPAKYLREIKYRAAAHRVLHAADQIVEYPRVRATFVDKFRLTPASSGTTTTGPPPHTLPHVSRLPVKASTDADPELLEPTRQPHVDSEDHGDDFVFYRLGDILSSFICSGGGQIRDFMNEQRLQYVLGNIRVPFSSITGRPERPITCSLYNIPIEHGEFMVLVQRHFAGKARGTHINASAFIASLFDVVRKYFLTGNAALDPSVVGKQQLRSNQIVLNDRDALTNNMNRRALRRRRLGSKRISLPPTGGRDNLRRYLVYSASPHPASLSEDDYDSYIIGANNSVIKKVSFAQSDNSVIEAWADDNIVASYRDEESNLIPQLYNVKMDLVGNVKFLPGYTFVLYPTILGLSDKSAERIHKRLGLSGTFVTARVEHRIGQNGFTTTLAETYNIPSTSRPGAANVARPAGP